MNDEKRFVRRKIILILGTAIVGCLLVVSVPFVIKTYGVWWLFVPVIVTFILSGVAIRLRHDWLGES